MSKPPPELPPTRAIAPDESLRAQTEAIWHHFPFTVYPQHVDHAGVVWHGSYIPWMEAARIEALRDEGVDYHELVALGCDMPVVEMSLRYQRPLRLGQEALLRTRFAGMSGVRLNFEQIFCSPDENQTYAIAEVTLVVLDAAKGKVMRRLPPKLAAALVKT